MYDLYSAVNIECYPDIFITGLCAETPAAIRVRRYSMGDQRPQTWQINASARERAVGCATRLRRLFKRIAILEGRTICHGDADIANSAQRRAMLLQFFGPDPGS